MCITPVQKPLQSKLVTIKPLELSKFSYETFLNPQDPPLEHIRKVDLRKKTADVDALFGLPVAVSFGRQMSIAVGLSLSKIFRIGSYPKSYSCKAFATSKLRQELIDYVLNRIPSIYTVLEDRHSDIFNTQVFSCFPNPIRHI
jgi:hypothetical protein